MILHDNTRRRLSATHRALLCVAAMTALALSATAGLLGSRAAQSRSRGKAPACKVRPELLPRATARRGARRTGQRSKS